MNAFKPAIGLEVHVQLSTQSKLFCSCPTTFGVQQNTNICEVCTGMPGALPTLNAKAIEYAVKAGLALNCTIHTNSLFSRKNYFYPDLPSGYQVSQHNSVICTSGFLDILIHQEQKRIAIQQIHLENDAGKNIHIPNENKSLIDLNRAGTPLIEIVSKPDMHSSSEAIAYLKKLYDIIMYLKISDGNMEEGSFRCDANVSINKENTQTLGTRTEIKNLNSFRNLQRALDYEIQRQQDVLEDGKTIIQETRLYDSVKNITLPMRTKETAHDYRYFPDPDLLPIQLTQEQIKQWEQELPELPETRRKRFKTQWDLSEQDVETLTSTPALADFFEAAVKYYPKPKRIMHIITDNVLRMLNIHGLSLQETKIKPEAIAELARIIDEDLISIKIAHDIFIDLFETGSMPETYIKEKGLIQISDTSMINAFITEVLAENPKEVQAYKNGKTKLIGFFVGQVMKKMHGQANPTLVNKALSKLLKQDN